MSNYPQQTVIVQQQPTNTLGVLGFCLMLLGWLTCGVLCVPALFVCGFAMFREPRGLALAGFVLSIPGVMGLIILIGLFAAGSLVGSAAIDESRRASKASVRSIQPADQSNRKASQSLPQTP